MAEAMIVSNVYSILDISLYKADEFGHPLAVAMVAAFF
jgi:hypothetical protein